MSLSIDKREQALCTPGAPEVLLPDGAITISEFLAQKAALRENEPFVGTEHFDIRFISNPSAPARLAALYGFDLTAMPRFTTLFQALNTFGFESAAMWAAGQADLTTLYTHFEAPLNFGGVSTQEPEEFTFNVASTHERDEKGFTHVLAKAQLFRRRKGDIHDRYVRGGSNRLRLYPYPFVRPARTDSQRPPSQQTKAEAPPYTVATGQLDITAQMIESFAKITHDTNPAHLTDGALTKSVLATPSTISHGMIPLTAGVAMAAMELEQQGKYHVVPNFVSVDFLKPVKTGSSVVFLLNKEVSHQPGHEYTIYTADAADYARVYAVAKLNCVLTNAH